MSKLYQTIEQLTDSAAAAQTLDKTFAAVTQVLLTTGGATATDVTKLTIQQSAPTSGSEAEFVGTAPTPSDTLTLDAAPAANGKLVVTGIRPGAIPTYQ